MKDISFRRDSDLGYLKMTSKKKKKKKMKKFFFISSIRRYRRNGR